MTAPPTLLPYQQLWVADQAEVKVCEKSRRIGLTWAEAADCVLLAATDGNAGMDVLYISYNQEMTREFIDTCAMWVGHYGRAAGEVEELIVKDGDRDIKAFRIDFASGHEIMALSSAPRNLRGKQGRLVLDEAAFVDNLAELIKASMAFCIWGGQVRIISTHNGDDNAFARLVEDCRAGVLPYSLHKYTFDDALADGLYERICMVRGKQWTAEGETQWMQGILAKYGEHADEELKCIPSKGGGRYLIRSRLEACMKAGIPVVRWEPPEKNFVDWSDEERKRDVDDWLEAHIGPLLAGLPPYRSAIGQDFARHVDLSVLWTLQTFPGLTVHPPFVLEMRDCPFSQQEQILEYVCRRLPRFTGGALDKGGNGAYLAERARQLFGRDRIVEVSFSESWNLENWPPLKQAFDDQTIWIPRHDDILQDLLQVKKEKGVPKILRDDRRVDRTEGKTSSGKRHGDAAVALVLAYFAQRTILGGEEFDVCTAMPRQTNHILRGWRRV